jgi:hypothetical protein
MTEITLPGSLGKTIPLVKKEPLYSFKTSGQRALAALKGAESVDEQLLAYNAVQAVTITKQNTVLKFAILTGDTTLNLTIDPAVKINASLLIRVPATADADDVTFGTGIDAAVLVGVAGKTKTQEFVYDGSIFVPSGAPSLID